MYIDPTTGYVMKGISKRKKDYKDCRKCIFFIDNDEWITNEDGDDYPYYECQKDGDICLDENIKCKMFKEVK